MSFKRACLLGLCWVVLLSAAFADNPCETFETFYSPSLGGAAPFAGQSRPQVLLLLTRNDVLAWKHEIVSGRYRKLGKSIFESDWSGPHRDAAAKMGQRLGAVLVLYAVGPVRTDVRARRFITPQWHPGEGGFVHGSALIPGQGMVFTQGSYWGFDSRRGQGPFPRGVVWKLWPKGD